jgi:hypothetical protein
MYIENKHGRNRMETLLPSQPGTYWQLIKASFHLYRVSFSRIILLSFFLAVTVFIPRLLSDFIGQDIFGNLAPFSYERLWLLVIYLAAIMFFIGMIWRMHCVIIGVHERLLEDFGIALKKVLTVLLAYVIEAAIVFAVSMILFGIHILLHQHHLLFYGHPLGLLLTGFIFIGQFILILYVSALFLFLIPIVAIENKGLFSALERSVLLVWNHWWRVFSVQFTPWLVYLALLLVIKYGFKIDVHIFFVEIGKTYSIWTSLLHLVIFALYIPWFTATLLVQLKDLELRKHISSQ